MSRRAAGFLKEWLAANIEPGRYRSDVEHNGLVFAATCERDAYNHGILKNELEEVVGNLDDFVSKAVDGLVTADAIQLEDHPEPDGNKP